MTTEKSSSDERRFINDRRHSDSGALFTQLDRRKTLQRRILNLDCHSIADWLRRPLAVPLVTGPDPASIEVL